MDDKMNKLKGIMGIREKEEHGPLKVMFFKEWAEYGFSQSQGSHREEQMHRMREMPR